MTIKQDHVKRGAVFTNGSDPVLDQVEPQPPGHHVILGGHHWLEMRTSEGEIPELIVLQWNPGVRRWSHSGNIATGGYVNAFGWKYVAVCPLP